MKLIKAAVAGSLESNDAMVTIEPGEEGINVEIDSIVLRQFGAQIERSVREQLSQMSVQSAKVRVIDKGAVDCTLRARVETAVLRAGEAEK